MPSLTTPARAPTRTLAATLGGLCVAGDRRGPRVIARPAEPDNHLATCPGCQRDPAGKARSFPGYEGDQRFGVPTLSYVQGTQSFRLGGNGIRPGSQIIFFAVNTDTGVAAGLVNPGYNYNTRGAGSNCVVNEEGPFVFALQPGNDRIQAAYIGGNSGQSSST